MAAAAVESCEVKTVKCADIPRDIENATADGAAVPRAATPRRQAELYRFRAADLLYYASSVSLFFADVATGEQRVPTHSIHTHTHTHVRRRAHAARERVRAYHHGASRDPATSDSSNSRIPHPGINKSVQFE